MLLDFSTQGALSKYRLLSNTITPRPIAWISTISERGTSNLAPFSFFGVVSSNPVVFSLCIGTKSDGSPKDTLTNLLSTCKATISFVMVDFLPLLERTASELPHDSSEASAFSIPLLSVCSDYPPIVQGVKVAYFCDLLECRSFSARENGDKSAFGGMGSSGESTIFLEAKSCFIDDELYQEDLRFLPPHVGRVGKFYLQVSELIDPAIE